MTYIPDTYNNDEIALKFTNYETFLELQKKYRTALELYLDKLVHLREVESEILKSSLEIPKTNDTEYNFYHQSQVLTSGYLYLRNNIHLERLSKEEIEYLIKADKIDDNFIAKTIPTVIYEEGERIFVGPPQPETEVLSQSVVIEFSFASARCTSTEQYFAIEVLNKKIFEILKENFQKAKIPLSCITYYKIPDYFLDDKKVVK